MKLKIKRGISLPRFGLMGFIKVSIWCVSALMIAFLFPARKSYEFSNLMVGMVSPREIIAPFSFYVEKSKQEIESLLKQMSKCELPFSCPHGRPTIINISLKELEKRFGRK